jgi:NTP pyrophosphatase (non-canonical NTP hydrolase)
MNKLIIDYYDKRFGDNINSAFIHLVREIGEIALAIEKANAEHAKLKITESTALLQYIASKYDLDLDANMQFIYTKKMDSLTRVGHR